jgi:RNA 2',3'-cyclic 3'-phosphodiesterase
MRIFLAVFPPPNVQRTAATVIEALRKPGDGVSWVKPENLHYTLRFIGDVGGDGLRRVVEGAQAAAAQHTAFDAAFGGVGGFPATRRARVLWIGMASGGPELEALAASLERELRRKGFEHEHQKFTAHLTIGRVREPREDWTDRLAKAATSLGDAPFRADRIAVVESALSPKGATYLVRTSAMLGG